MVKQIDEAELDIRAKATVDHINSAVKRSKERGGRRYPGKKTPATQERLVSNGQISIFKRNYLLQSASLIHNLSLPTLQKLPKYLIDILVNPSATFAVTIDHFEYWAWTAAVASNLEESPIDIGNLNSLIHFASFPIRVTPSAVHPNPAVSGILMHRWNLIQVASFPILEGIISEYIEPLSQSESSIVAEQEIQCTWAPSHKVSDWNKGDSVNGYHHLVQIWRKYGTESDITESVLDEINNLEQYEMSSLRWKFDDSDKVLNEELKDGTSNFLRLVVKYRNENLHGESEESRIAPLLLTVCCVALWDIISEYNYPELRKRTIQNIKMKHEPIHPFWPAAFYPLFPVE